MPVNFHLKNRVLPLFISQRGNRGTLCGGKEGEKKRNEQVWSGELQNLNKKKILHCAPIGGAPKITKTGSPLDKTKIRHTAKSASIYTHHIRPLSRVGVKGVCRRSPNVRVREWSRDLSAHALLNSRRGPPPQRCKERTSKSSRRMWRACFSWW